MSPDDEDAVGRGFEKAAEFCLRNREGFQSSLLVRNVVPDR